MAHDRLRFLAFAFVFPCLLCGCGKKNANSVPPEIETAIRRLRFFAAAKPESPLALACQTALDKLLAVKEWETLRPAPVFAALYTNDEKSQIAMALFYLDRRLEVRKLRLETQDGWFGEVPFVDEKVLDWSTRQRDALLDLGFPVELADDGASGLAAIVLPDGKLLLKIPRIRCTKDLTLRLLGKGDTPSIPLKVVITDAAAALINRPSTTTRPAIDTNSR